VKLIEALEKYNVDITFNSLTSGREITKTYHLRTLFKINQNPLSEKLLVWAVRAEEWEDIEKSTIKKWSICE
jgi:hypothetical protein